jgi:hypothetical protein
MNRFSVLALVALAFLSACAQPAKEQKINEDEKQAYLAIGDSIASVSQKTLMRNVSEAIKAKGVVGAIDFCKLNANALSDSLGKQYRAVIQRKSDRNRNDANAIQSEDDQEVWQQLKTLLADKSSSAKHLVRKTDEGVFYYKAINLALPTCLSCHGKPGIDISPEAMAAIQQKYPKDKATGYALGDLRGMWKLKID